MIRAETEGRGPQLFPAPPHPGGTAAAMTGTQPGANRTLSQFHAAEYAAQVGLKDARDGNLTSNAVFVINRLRLSFVPQLCTNASLRSSSSSWNRKMCDLNTRRW